jgi:hypothetical protein
VPDYAIDPNGDDDETCPPNFTENVDWAESEELEESET